MTKKTADQLISSTLDDEDISIERVTASTTLMTVRKVQSKARPRQSANTPGSRKAGGTTPEAKENGQDNPAVEILQGILGGCGKQLWYG
jgi:hypothetical protein